jgi:hypothetical protein
MLKSAPVSKVPFTEPAVLGGGAEPAVVVPGRKLTWQAD